MAKNEITEQVSEELKRTFLGLIEESLTEYQNIHIKPSFVETMKEHEVKLRDIHQQSTDKFVNTVFTSYQKLEQCSTMTEQIDNNKEEDDHKRRQNNMIMFNLAESSATLSEEQFKEDCNNKKNLITTRMKLDPKINIYQLCSKTLD